MKENKTEGLANYFLFQKKENEKYGVQEESLESTYYNLLESCFSPDMDDPKFTALWSERSGVILIFRMNDNGEFNGLVVDKNVKFVNCKQSTGFNEALYTAAVGKLLRDTVDFEELKNFCLSKGVFSEKDLEREMLKRAVKA